MSLATQVIALKKDSYLFLQTDDADCMYIVKSGKIGLFVSDYLVEKLISNVGPGELIGEISLFDGLNRSASAKALQDSEVVVLPFENLRAELRTMPEWVQISLKTLAYKLRKANNMVLNANKKQD